MTILPNDGRRLGHGWTIFSPRCRRPRLAWRRAPATPDFAGAGGGGASGRGGLAIPCCPSPATVGSVKLGGARVLSCGGSAFAGLTSGGARPSGATTPGDSGGCCGGPSTPRGPFPSSEYPIAPRRDRAGVTVGPGCEGAAAAAGAVGAAGGR